MSIIPMERIQVKRLEADRLYQELRAEKMETMLEYILAKADSRLEQTEGRERATWWYISKRALEGLAYR